MKLNYRRTFFVGLAFLSISAFWQLYDTIIPLILSDTFGLKETVTGMVMSVDNVLALFLLPLFGAFSDRVNTRLGKRTPFIIVGTMFAVISMVVLPIADLNRNLPLFVIALGIVLFAMGTYRSPAVALMPDVTPKPLRSKANAIINLMGAAGGVITLLLIKVLVKKSEHPNYSYVFWTVAAIMVLAVAVLVATIKENKERIKEPEEKEIEIETKKEEKLEKPIRKSLTFLLVSVSLWFIAYNAVTTAFSRYAVKVWGLEGGSFANSLLVATVAAIISYIPIGMISSKVGRKKTILLGIIVMSVAYFCGFFFTNYSPVITLIFVFVGFGWAAINVNSYPMVVEMSRGCDVGKFTGLYYTFSMSAQIITPILSGMLLEHVSYRTLFPYALFFSMASFATMLLVKHGDVIPDKKSKLECFDVED